MKQQLPFGTNEPGKPFSIERGGWQRVDVYRSADDGMAYNERRFAACPEDSSEPLRHYGPNANGHYNPACSCCWLGFSHTLAMHEASIAKARGE